MVLSPVKGGPPRARLRPRGSGPPLTAVALDGLRWDRVCTGQRDGRRPHPSPVSCDTDGLRAASLEHPVQGRQQPLPSPDDGPRASARNHRSPVYTDTDRRFNQGSPTIAPSFLPAHATALGDFAADVDPALSKRCWPHHFEPRSSAAGQSLRHPDGLPRRKPFHGEGHCKVWARLRVAGVRTSKRRVLRLMRENDLLAPSRVGSPHGPRSMTEPSSRRR
jgi:hypothetical protein